MIYFILFSKRIRKKERQMSDLIFGDFPLSKPQEEKLNTLVKSCPDILGIRYFSNINTTSDEDVPSGIAMYFPFDAQVDSTLISDNMFQVFAVSSVLAPPYGIALSDDHFSGKLSSINEAVQQYPKLPASSEVRNPVDNKDCKPWNSELGGPGSFVGVYFQLRDDHRTKDYYYVAQGTVPLVVRDLKQRINEKAPTFRDLLYGPEWKGVVDHAGYMAQRNVQKNLSLVAEAYQTSIARVDDIGAALVDEKGKPVPHMAKPERAVPNWQQNTYSIRTALFKGKQCVAIYNGIVPKEECTRDRLFVVANAYDGIYSFPLSKCLVQVPAVPADTGKSDTTSATRKNTKNLSIIACEGTNNLSHDDFSNPLTKPVKESIKAVGWNPENHVGLLVPLAIKMYNPELKRK
jgi:hypothetical protein